MSQDLRSPAIRLPNPEVCCTVLWFFHSTLLTKRERLLQYLADWCHQSGAHIGLKETLSYKRFEQVRICATAPLYLRSTPVQYGMRSTAVPCLPRRHLARIRINAPDCLRLVPTSFPLLRKRKSNLAVRRRTPVAAHLLLSFDVIRRYGK